MPGTWLCSRSVRLVTTEAQARAYLDGTLDRLGVRTGDRIMLGIDMSGIPLPHYRAALTRDAFRERERQWCGFVLQALRDRLGRAGTLLVPAFSYSCGRPGSTFVAETTPSEVGPFPEFVRVQPDAIRSVHPIFSLAGLGQDAGALLGDVGRSAFGSRSPFARFAAAGIRFLCLGVELRNCITYIHHLEQMYGCPHRFHKSFDSRVTVEGREWSGDWYAYVGYRGLDYTSDITTLQDALRGVGALAEADWNGRVNHLAEISAVDAAGYQLLSVDAGAFLNRRLSLRFEEPVGASEARSDRSTMVIEDIRR